MMRSGKHEANEAWPELSQLKRHAEKAQKHERGQSKCNRVSTTHQELHNGV